MRIDWNDFAYFSDTYYRVYLTEGKRYYDGQKILADFTDEDEAIRFCEEQEADGVDCDMTAILSSRDYYDLYPSAPIEL